MRTVLVLTTLALGLNACAPEEDEKDDGHNVKPGYELATAKAADTSEAASEVIDVSVQELVERLETGHTVLIDVRTDEEVATGIIEGARHIPMDAFDPAKIDISQYDHVLFYCRSGRRSKIVAEQYSAYSGEAELHLAGGIKAWRAAGLATVKPEQ